MHFSPFSLSFSKKATSCITLKQQQLHATTQDTKNGSLIDYFTADSHFCKRNSMTTRENILSAYRILHKLIRNLPPDSKFNSEQQLQVLKTTFRKNATLTDEHDIKSCMQQAGEKIAFLRIVTPKKQNITNVDSSRGIKRWIFTKDGKIEMDTEVTGRKNGRVVSNWDGNNLDPCAVNTHRGQLKRMGFVNNLHAKGLF